MRNITQILLPIVIILIASGCATRRQVQELRLQVDTMRAENARIDSLLNDNLKQSRKVNADFGTYITRLEDRMTMIEARLQDAISLMNQATSAIQTGNIRHGGERPQNPDSTTADTSSRSGDIDCQKVYNTAYYDVVKENYDMAINGFKNYLKICPNTALADNAQFWIGQCYYLQKKYENAETAFEELIRAYPSSERLAAAKLKLGKTLFELRQKTKARPHFEDVIRDYPGTDEAKEAADMLQRYR
jgi:tol-pal system protein YbgF